MQSKHLFYVANDHLCAWQWRERRLSGGTRFAFDRAGMDEFAHFLEQQSVLPCILIADLVEEDFQRQSMPHVRGRAGRNLIGRRLAQLYRDTPYRQAFVQGRDTEGRRDDQVMLSALTNPGPVQQWVAILEQYRMPLAAMYSAALLSSELVRALGIAQQHLLLITSHTGGLRQSYFQGSDLKFSRLTAPDEGDAVARVAAETARMQQFLTSTHLLERGHTLRVVVLAPASHMDEYEQLCDDGPETAFHFIDLEGVTHQLSLDRTPILADPVLLTLAARLAPPSHYDPGPIRRFFQLWQARRSLFAATGAVAAIALLSVALDTWTMVRDSRETARLVGDTARLDEQYRAGVAAMPPTAASPAHMKAAVLAGQQLDTQAPRPGQLLTIVSHALENAPSVRLTGLDWQVARTPMTAAAVGVPAAPPQALRIDGEVDTAQGDYRAVLGTMNRLVQEMNSDGHVLVQVVTAPVNTRKDMTITGKAGGDEGSSKAPFTLNVSYTP
jgi:hypothetical protein